MIISAARSSAAAFATGSSTGCGGTIGTRSHSFAGNIFGKLEVDRAGPLLLRYAECFTHQRRNHAGETIWRESLVSGRIAADDVDDLESRLPR